MTASPSAIELPAALAVRAFLAERPQQKVFLEHEVKKLLSDAGLPVPRGLYLDKADSAMASLSSHQLNYPLVVKVASSAIAHKTDVGGVVTGIRNADELREAVERVLAIEGAGGALVEEMAPKGIEVIVGGVMDPQFGPVIMFGLGGVFVELYRDVVFGLAPLSPEDAALLVERIKGLRLLHGFRGEGAADIPALAKVMAAASEMMATGMVGELDLNPVAVYPKGAIILDAKMKSAAL